jgi:hypothetical protein
MGLDIRWPIGLMFSLIGLLLAGYGILTSSDTAMYARSLGININIIWGVVLLVFGAIMLLLAWTGRNKSDAAPTATSSK